MYTEGILPHMERCLCHAHFFLNGEQNPPKRLPSLQPDKRNLQGEKVNNT